MLIEWMEEREGIEEDLETQKLMQTVMVLLILKMLLLSRSLLQALRNFRR